MRKDWRPKDLKKFFSDPEANDKRCTACGWTLPETMFDWRTGAKLARVAKCRPCIRSKKRTNPVFVREIALTRDRVILEKGEFRYKIIPGGIGTRDPILYHYHKKFCEKIYPDEMGEYLTATELAKLPRFSGLTSDAIRERIRKLNVRPDCPPKYTGLGVLSEHVVGDNDTPRLAQKFICLVATGEWQRNSLAVDWGKRA